MDEQQIWAPWRLGYVSGEESDASSPIVPKSWQSGAAKDCFICRAAALYDDVKSACRQNMVLTKGVHSLAMLNRYPYSNGHILISPLRHVGHLTDLNADEHLELMQSLGNFTEILSKLISAKGFNLGLNLGSAGGAGVPGHLHWHLVPRWPGDNNFMPTIAGTRVISQSLESLWEALRDELD